MIAFKRKSRDKRRKPAVFLDRDGTLTRDGEGYYLTDIAKLKIYKCAAKALKIIQDAGYLLIIVTNQAAIGRGFMSAGESIAINLRLKEYLRKKGVFIDGIYFCPHRPEDGCDCRKPKTGLAREALKNHAIDLERSCVIGDKLSDMRFARGLKIRSFFVKTGHGAEQMRKYPEIAKGSVSADIYGAAVRIRNL